MAIRHWLLKTEPGEYSFRDLVERKREVWDGITNALALRHLRSVRRGDLALIYHTGTERAAVGIARFVGEPYPDPRKDAPSRPVVEIEPVRALDRPVTLEEMKKSPKLAGLDLLRLPRLSFLPVSRPHWEAILKMSGPRR